MSKEKTVTINGREFDAVTGMPVKSTSASKSSTSIPKAPARKSSAKAPASAKTVHTSTQRSKTLNRKLTKKPATAAPKSAQSTAKRRLTMDISRSKSISRFAPVKPRSTTAAATTTRKPASKPVSADVKPIQHPAAAKATKEIAKKRAAKPSTKPAAEIKKEAISKALAAPAKQTAAKKPKARKKKEAKKLSKRNVWAFAIVAGIILIGVAGFISYTKIPSVSVSFAAWRSGIDASYPTYRIDGYEFQGPAVSKNNEVIISFASPVHDSSFTLTQAKSLWDSSALELSIQEEFQNNYSKTTGNGLTIFTYDDGKKASWVSEQILYTIEGDSLPVGDHIRRLAISF